MKIKISDMMDHLENAPIEIREKDIASAELIKEVTMKKIHKTSSQTHVVRKISRAGVIAAAMVTALCITVAAAAVIKWGGFAFTDGMTDAEKNAFIKDASIIYSREYEDENGYVHYLDENGEEVMVLSPKEAAEYEFYKKAAKDQAVQESTSLIDASTLPFMPHVITELAVGDDGQFAECALGNGSMILLHPADKEGFDLKAGDVVTVELTSNDECILEIGCFKDGDFVGAETVSAQLHNYSLTIETDGLYCFTIEYRSAGVSTFAGCSIKII